MLASFNLCKDSNFQPKGSVSVGWETLLPCPSICRNPPLSSRQIPTLWLTLAISLTAIVKAQTIWPQNSASGAMMEDSFCCTCSATDHLAKLSRIYVDDAAAAAGRVELWKSKRQVLVSQFQSKSIHHFLLAWPTLFLPRCHDTSCNWRVQLVSGFIVELVTGFPLFYVDSS